MAARKKSPGAGARGSFAVGWVVPLLRLASVAGIGLEQLQILQPEQPCPANPLTYLTPGGQCSHAPGSNTEALSNLVGGEQPFRITVKQHSAGGGACLPCLSAHGFADGGTAFGDGAAAMFQRGSYSRQLSTGDARRCACATSARAMCR